MAKFDENADWASEARRYYLNIVGKYGPQVQALLKKAAALDIQTICPVSYTHLDVYKRQVQLYYFPAKTANAKYAIVVPGNGGNTTAELNDCLLYTSRCV